MTTPNPTENTPQAGALQDANLDASQTAGAGASQGTDELRDLLKSLTKRVEAAENVSRSKQSEADKVTAAVRKDFKKEIEPIVESARRSLNLTDEQTVAYRNQLIQDEMQRRVFDSEPSSPASPALQGSEAQGAADTSVKRLVEKMQLDINDPQVVQAIRENRDIVDLSAAFAEIQYVKKTSPTPTPATMAPPAGGASVASSLSVADIERKAGELDALLREPTMNAAKIAALQRELGPDYA